jgi:hypothetical protein
VILTRSNTLFFTDSSDGDCDCDGDGDGDCDMDSTMLDWELLTDEEKEGEIPTMDLIAKERNDERLRAYNLHHARAQPFVSPVHLGGFVSLSNSPKTTIC